MRKYEFADFLGANSTNILQIERLLSVKTLQMFRLAQYLAPNPTDLHFFDILYQKYFKGLDGGF